jgi:hypothetical protein
MTDPNFTLSLQTRLGANLKESIVDAVRIARVLNVAVRFDFWGEKLTVWPDTDPDKFIVINKKRLGLIN